MDANQMANQIRADERLAGLDINVTRHGNVEVYGFNATQDWRVTKSVLESLGFSCGPNFGMWEGDAEPQPTIRERYEEMTPEEQAKADDTWVKMGGAL